MWLKSLVFIFIVCMKNCKSERRIVLGKPTLGEKGFMVYLVKSEKSDMKFYDSWICGGAIVSPTHILTAAACITDVSHIYAIAGYRKYVRTEYLETDECTKNRKQRVVKTCTPKSYSFNYGLAHRWIGMDIGFAIVEKPYNFSDLTYRMDCSYVPRAISINFDPKYTGMHENMMIYGWGHSRSLRAPGDTTNYNSLYLQGASTRTVTKRYCKNFFVDENMKKIIERYMICTIGAGNLNSEGEIIDPGKYVFTEGCSRREMVLEGKCAEHDYDIDYSLETRRNTSDKLDTSNNTITHNKTRIRTSVTRRQGICQNDHGGPLVTWVGNKEVVVGVASTSLHDEHNYCIAPSIYTSTHCTMRFILCSLQLGTPESGRKMCDNLGKEEGYELHEADVNWGDEIIKNGSAVTTMETDETTSIKNEGNGIIQSDSIRDDADLNDGWSDDIAQNNSTNNKILNSETTSTKYEGNDVTLSDTIGKEADLDDNRFQNNSTNNTMEFSETLTNINYQKDPLRSGPITNKTLKNYDWDEIVLNNAEDSKIENSVTKNDDSKASKSESRTDDINDTMNWYAVNSIVNAGESSGNGSFEVIKEDNEGTETTTEKIKTTDTAIVAVVVM